MEADFAEHRAKAGRARWANVTAEERAEVLSRAAKAFFGPTSLTTSAVR